MALKFVLGFNQARMWLYDKIIWKNSHLEEGRIWVKDWWRHKFAKMLKLFKPNWRMWFLICFVLFYKLWNKIDVWFDIYALEYAKLHDSSV